jgi:hypothetical protein
VSSVNQGVAASQINAASQRLCAWGGPVLILSFLLGWGFIGTFVPLPTPTDTPEQVVQFFQANPTRIRIGLLMCMTGAAFLGLWTAAISVQLKRIEGGVHTPLTYAQLAVGAVSIVEFIPPLTIWAACAFRPDADPMITYRLNDLAWLMWVSVDASFVLQAILIGIAILKDKRKEPIFPRWLAYLSFWCSLLFLPGGLCIFFKTGLFAWNGLIAFWILAIAYVIWVLAITAVLLIRVIPRQEQEEQQARRN